MTFRNATDNLEPTVQPLLDEEGDTIEGDERRHVIEALLGDPLGTPATARATAANQRIETAGDLATRIAQFRRGKERQSLFDKIASNYALLPDPPTTPSPTTWIETMLSDAIASLPAPGAPGVNKNTTRAAFFTSIKATINTRIGLILEQMVKPREKP